jgi:hypothetical protein
VRAAFIAACLLALPACRRPEPTIVAITMTDERACAITKHRELHCWGGGSFHPVLRNGVVADEVALGDAFECIRTNTRVQCTHRVEAFEADRVYAVGARVCTTLAGALRCAVGAEPFADVATDVQLVALTRAHTMVRTRAGMVQLDRQEIPALARAVAIAVSDTATCGVLGSGEVLCSENGRAFDAWPGVRASAVTISPDFTCVRTVDARLLCKGVLAGKTFEPSEPVFGLFGVSSIASNARGVCAALGLSEGARCLGDNRTGTLGAAQPLLSVPMPVRFPR